MAFDPHQRPPHYSFTSKGTPAALAAIISEHAGEFVLCRAVLFGSRNGSTSLAATFPPPIHQAGMPAQVSVLLNLGYSALTLAADHLTGTAAENARAAADTTLAAAFAQKETHCG